MKKATSAATVHDVKRMLVMFHDGGPDTNVHYHALAWLERVKGQPTVVALHLLRNDDGRVIHEKKKADEVQYLEPGMGKTTAEEFEVYLRKKLVTNGGNTGAYDYLNVPRPIVDVVISPEKQADLGELYKRAAQALGVDESALRSKYGKLNPGLQAMNLRNRLRSKGKTV